MVCSPAWNLRVGGCGVCHVDTCSSPSLDLGSREKRRKIGSRSLPSPLITGQWREAGVAGLPEVWCGGSSVWRLMWRVPISTVIMGFGGRAQLPHS